MASLCIIPARGGSQRIPRKNVRPLCGRPLLAWTVATAHAAGVFDTIMVSTDDAEIAAIARAAGADVPFMRSAATAGDHASTTAVIEEVLATYAAANEAPFERICCVYPTAVLLRPEQLRDAMALLATQPEVDSVLSVQRYRHPIERALRIEGGTVAPIDPSQIAKRTQDLVPAFHDAGQFYAFRPDVIARCGRLLGAHCAPVELAAWEAVDLDVEADWALLERLFTPR